MKSHLKIVYAKVSDPGTELDGTLQSINGKIMLLAKNGDIISNCIPATAMNLKPGDSFKTFNLTIKLPTLIQTSLLLPLVVEYDIMYTKDKTRKVKRWCDGLLKYNESERLAVFYDEEGKELLKKVITSSKVREGEMLDTAHWLIEITARKINALQGDVTKPLIENHSDVKRPFVTSRQVIPIAKKSKPIEATISKNGKSTEENENSVEWNIVYTEDKHKKLKKKWLDGRMIYNSVTEETRFYDDQEAVIFHRKLTANQVYEGAELDSGRYEFVINEPSKPTAITLTTNADQFIPANKVIQPPPTGMKMSSFKVRKDIEQNIAHNAKRLKNLSVNTLNERQTLSLKTEILNDQRSEEEPDSIIHFTSDAPPQTAFKSFTSGKAVLMEEYQKENIERNDDDNEEDDELIALLGDGKPKSKSLFN